MADPVNFTGSIDGALRQRAKVIAAKSETSVNALFNAELRPLVETFEAAEAASNGNAKTLLDFSLGRADGRQAMVALGSDNNADLSRLMAQAPLPMPRLAVSTRAMTDTLHTLTKQSKLRCPLSCCRTPAP